MNGCENFEGLLARRLHGGGLSPAEGLAVEAHLAGCVSCRTVAEELAVLHESLLRLPQDGVEPPRDLSRRILAHLSVSSLAAERWRRAALGAGAMAAGVLLTLAVQQTLPVKAPAPGASTASAPQAAPSASVTAKGPGAEASPAVDSRPSRPAPAPARLASAAPVAAPVVVREVKIFLFHPEAKQVAVTGDFNNWDAAGVPLRPGDRPGLWEGELRLGPGAYSYNFIVDGDVLVPDPSSADQAPDGYGGTNSILLVKGAPSS
jgi:hypothetical protein